MLFKGRAHKFGDNINTDEIIPARYLNTNDPQELAEHCMEDADSKFAKKVKKGDIIVAGKNFGCGSSREHAPIAIKACEVSCVVAESFARIFYRNAINIGLPIIISKDAPQKVKSGNRLSIDITKGRMKNLTKKENYNSDIYPKFIQKIIAKGGLMNSI